MGKQSTAATATTTAASSSTYDCDISHDDDDSNDCISPVSYKYYHSFRNHHHNNIKMNPHYYYYNNNNNSTKGISMDSDIFSFSYTGNNSAVWSISSPYDPFDGDDNNDSSDDDDDDDDSDDDDYDHTNSDSIITRKQNKASSNNPIIGPHYHHYYASRKMPLRKLWNSLHALQEIFVSSYLYQTIVMVVPNIIRNIMNQLEQRCIVVLKTILAQYNNANNHQDAGDYTHMMDSSSKDGWLQTSIVWFRTVLQRMTMDPLYLHRMTLFLSNVLLLQTPSHVGVTNTTIGRVVVGWVTCMMYAWLACDGIQELLLSASTTTKGNTSSSSSSLLTFWYHCSLATMAMTIGSVVYHVGTAIGMDVFGSASASVSAPLSFAGNNQESSSFYSMTTLTKLWFCGALLPKIWALVCLYWLYPILQPFQTKTTTTTTTNSSSTNTTATTTAVTTTPTLTRMSSSFSIGSSNNNSKHYRRQGSNKDITTTTTITTTTKPKTVSMADDVDNNDRMECLSVTVTILNHRRLGLGDDEKLRLIFDHGNKDGSENKKNDSHNATINNNNHNHNTNDHGDNDDDEETKWNVTISKFSKDATACIDCQVVSSSSSSSASSTKNNKVIGMARIPIPQMTNIKITSWYPIITTPSKSKCKSISKAVSKASSTTASSSFVKTTTTATTTTNNNNNNDNNIDNNDMVTIDEVIMKRTMKQRMKRKRMQEIITKRRIPKQSLANNSARTGAGNGGQIILVEIQVEPKDQWHRLWMFLLVGIMYLFLTVLVRFSFRFSTSTSTSTGTYYNNWNAGMTGWTFRY